MHRRNWGVIACSVALLALPLLAVVLWLGCACLEPTSARCQILRIVGAVLGLCLGGAALSAIVGLTRSGQRIPAVFAVLIAAFAGFAAVVFSPHHCHFIPEATAIGDVRTVMSAEKDYAALNGGRYATLDCLAGRGVCGGRLPPTGPLLSVELLSAERLGFRRVFHPGAPAPGTASSSAFATFAYTAVPIEWGRSGVRSFGGDDRGVVCATLGPSAPVVGGRCDMSHASSCKVVR